MKLKYMPNAFSIARIVLCIPLVVLPLFNVLEPFELTYILLFALAGITDAIDGQLARRIKDAKSELGATLDSVADICLVAVIVFIIMPSMQLWSWLWTAYMCVLLLKVTVSTAIGIIRFKEFVSLHTISFKILIVFLFAYPILYYLIRPGIIINIYTLIMLCCGVLIVIEEILIISTSNKPYRNIKSIFDVSTLNRENELQNETITTDKEVKLQSD